jgi:putative hydrolase of the HAD superfamily
VSRFRVLFLDLDDTLYPNSSGLWEAIRGRIRKYMVQRLGLPPGRAEALGAEYLHTYGTTLNGLMADFRVDPHDYLAYVHDVPVEELLRPDPALRAMLESLPQRRVVFTNASRDHVERVLGILGIGDLIDEMVDILALEFHNKPLPDAYRRALLLAGERDPEACVLVDDRVDNLLPATEMGMTTVLVGDHDPGSQIDHRIALITDLPQTVTGLIDSGFS